MNNVNEQEISDETGLTAEEVAEACQSMISYLETEEKQRETGALEGEEIYDMFI